MRDTRSCRPSPVPCPPYPAVAGYSLFPIPYSLFPIPYSLFPIPYSLFPIPYSIPYSLFPIPYSLQFHASPTAPRTRSIVPAATDDARRAPSSSTSSR
jgi:hypothetical protein